MRTPAWRVVIVNYRTGALAARAAQQARIAVGDGDEIVVVDNASGDDSVERLTNMEGIRLETQADNRGYGAALNVGARGFEGDYLLLQNADTTITSSLPERFRRHFELLPTLGIMAPRLMSDDGTIQPSCRRFPTHRSILMSRGSPLGVMAQRNGRTYLLPEPATFTMCDVVAGACLAIRNDTWKALDGMDENFFLYAEDTDICRRAKNAGWLVGYDPSVQISHAWGASRAAESQRTAGWHAQSLVYYFRKHYPKRYVANALLSRLLYLNAAWRGGKQHRGS